MPSVKSIPYIPQIIFFHQDPDMDRLYHDGARRAGLPVVEHTVPATCQRL